MLRIGVHFEQLPATEQGALDRYVFRQLRDEAKRKRHLWGMLGVGEPGERRSARRVAVMDDSSLTLTLQLVAETLPLAVQVQVVAAGGDSAWDAPRPIALCNISSSGCACLCGDAAPLAVGTLLDLEVRGPAVELRLRGRVVYVLRH